MSRKHRPHNLTQPIVDIVVVTGGRWDMLEKCLSSIDRCTHVPYNVILIDNATESVEKAEHMDLFEGLSTKRLTNREGYAYAHNEGARMGHAPLILFLDDDIELTEGCIDAMVRTLDDPQYGVCGAKLIFPEDSTNPARPAGKVQHVGHALNINAQVIHPLMGWSKDNPKTCISREVFSVTGACLMTRRSLFSKVGGLDIAYGAGYYEDTDYCLKVKQLGGKIYMNAEAVAYHYTGATGVEKNKIQFPMQINAMRFVSRWSETGLMIWSEWEFY